MGVFLGTFAYPGTVAVTSTKNRLPAVVGKGFVGFRHAVSVFAFFYR